MPGIGGNGRSMFGIGPSNGFSNGGGIGGNPSGIGTPDTNSNGMMMPRAPSPGINNQQFGGMQGGTSNGLRFGIPQMPKMQMQPQAPGMMMPLPGMPSQGMPQTPIGPSNIQELLAMLMNQGRMG